MNSFKSKIIKSEAVKIVTKDAGGSGPEDDRLSPARSRNKAEENRQQLERIAREAYEKGLAEGVQRGRELRDREGAGALKAAEEAVRQAARMKASILEGLEEDILRLALDIAEKVLHHEAALNRDVVRNIFRSAVSAINDRENIRVRCHPDDLDYLREIRPELMQEINGVHQLEFVEDAAVGRGGVRLETGFGEVDARMDKQLDVIRASLLP